MRKEVEEYLKRARIEDRADRDRLLVQAGLYEAEYASDGPTDALYPEVDAEGRRYRKRALEVTEEECAAVRPGAAQGRGNALAYALLGLAAALYLGFFLYGFFTGTAVSSWLTGAVLGTLCLGLGEALCLLSDINAKL